MMEFIHEPNRIYLENDKEQLLAEITYSTRYCDKYIITHTYVSPALRGQKIGEQLLRMVVEQARKEKLKIIPPCSFALKEFMSKKEYADVWEK